MASCDSFPERCLPDIMCYSPFSGRGQQNQKEVGGERSRVLKTGVELSICLVFPKLCILIFNKHNLILHTSLIL